MKKFSILMTLIGLVGLLLSGVPTGNVWADGTETLGPPSVPIASGTGIVLAGTGMIAQPGVISIDIPLGVTVEQVLLYWEGEGRLGPPPGDDQIVANGIPVNGTLIGGPTFFFNFEVDGIPGPVYSSAYRADITALGLVIPGPNMISLSDMDFGTFDNGAGVLVIFDDGASVPASIDVRDGSDLAFINFAPPIDATVPQAYAFAASASDRSATLGMFFGSVGANRPNRIQVTVDGVTNDFDNLLGATDGEEWDTVVLPVNIPAGATMLTVQAISFDDGSGNLPASLDWVVSALSIPGEEDGGGDGCTPGYWKNHLVSWAPTGLDPGDDFDTTFSVDFFNPDITLDDAVNLGGGGVKKVARHGTAALLNALHPDVNYPLSAADVIAAVQAQDLGDIVAFNELSSNCPAEN